MKKTYHLSLHLHHKDCTISLKAAVRGNIPSPPFTFWRSGATLSIRTTLPFLLRMKLIQMVTKHRTSKLNTTSGAFDSIQFSAIEECIWSHLRPYFFSWCNSPLWARACSLSRLNDHKHSTLGRTPLDEWWAQRRDLYLTTHNTHKRQAAMPPVGFESTIPASERPRTYLLDRAATGIKALFL